MSKEKGYEKLDAMSECKDQKMEKMRRMDRIMGHKEIDMPMDYEMENIIEGGFIPRNNVKDRL